MDRKGVKPTNSGALQTSGKTAYVEGTTRLRLKIPKKLASSALAPGSLLQTYFGRITPDAAPGWNTIIIGGFPANTRVISVQVTEWVEGNLSHAGDAFYTTSSVQLFDSGRQCRVRFFLNWRWHLPTGVMVIFGPA